MLDNQKRYNSAFEPSDCTGKVELDEHNYKELGNRPETHFIRTLLKNAGEWRFVCGNEDCLKFEETSKFMKCGGVRTLWAGGIAQSLASGGCGPSTSKSVIGIKSDF